MQSLNLHQGYNLIDVLLVAVVCGVTFSMAMPIYAQYQSHLRFGEAIEVLETSRIAIDDAVAAGDANSVTDLDSNSFGIPPAVTRTATNHGLSVVDGTITLTWMADGSELAGETYTLTVNGLLPPVQWLVSGSCLHNDYC